MYSDLLISLVYVVVFKCLSLECLAPKRKQKDKWSGEGWNQPIKSLKGIQLEGKWLATGEVKQWLPTSLHLCYQEQQWSEHRSQYLEDRVLFLHPGSHKLYASCSEDMHIVACHSWSMWDRQKLQWILRVETEIKSNLLSKPSPGICKPSTDSTNPIFGVTSDRFSNCNYCLGRETNFWCLLLCHLPRIFIWFFEF